MEKIINVCVEIVEGTAAPDNVLVTNVGTAIYDAVVATYATTYNNVKVKDITICDDKEQ